MCLGSLEALNPKLHDLFGTQTTYTLSRGGGAFCGRLLVSPTAKSSESAAFDPIIPSRKQQAFSPRRCSADQFLFVSSASAFERLSTAGFFPKRTTHCFARVHDLKEVGGARSQRDAGSSSSRKFRACRGFTFEAMRVWGLVPFRVYVCRGLCVCGVKDWGNDVGAVRKECFLAIASTFNIQPLTLNLANP